MFGKKKNDKKPEQVKEEPKKTKSLSERTIIVKDCQANIRYARNFKHSSEWDWDDEHKHIVVTFNESDPYNTQDNFKRITDRANEDEVATYNIAKAIIKHITENPKDWDIYRNIEGHVIGKATINGNKVTVTADYFSGFNDSDEDVFFIEIEMKNKKHVSILKEEVNHYIKEDTWTALSTALANVLDEENMPKLEAELCGK